MSDDLPHVIGGGDREGIICPQGSEWYKPKHMRRGRLVEWACGMTAAGKLPADHAWWSQHSGERDDDRVEHEECREYVDAFMRFLAIGSVTVVRSYPQIEVVHPSLNYQGHIDQVWRYAGAAEIYREADWIVDIKCGEPQPWHALQLAAYRDAYGTQYHCPLPPALNIYLPSMQIVERNDYRDVLDMRALARAYRIKKERGLR